MCKRAAAGDHPHADWHTPTASAPARPLTHPPGDCSVRAARRCLLASYSWGRGDAVADSFNFLRFFGWVTCVLQYMWAHPSAGNIARQWAATAPGAHLSAHAAAALQTLLHLLHELLQLQLLQGGKEEGRKGQQEWWVGMVISRVRGSNGNGILPS